MHVRRLGAEENSVAVSKSLVSCRCRIEVLFDKTFLMSYSELDSELIDGHLETSHTFVPPFTPKMGLTCICSSYAANVGNNFCATFGTLFLTGISLDLGHFRHPYLRDILLLLSVCSPETWISKLSDIAKRICILMIRRLAN